MNAQQARRILDRIVGFELSPVLWRKVKPALSAGRVQSVAVRLIVEREREIHAFKSEAAYRVTAVFLVPDTDGKLVEMKAELAHRIKTKKEAEAFLNACKGANFAIEDITTRPLKKTPPAPFTTSTLQQEAARKLGYTVAQTMMIAQRLYESGFITYMRTDSVNLSEFATIGSKDAIIKMMGERYVHPRHFETKTKGAQEAHEAIRPTYMENQSIEGTAQEKKLYDLIWKRTIASQMADAELEKTTVTISISSSSEVFTAIGEVIKFDGFLRVYRESYDDENEQEDESNLLPPLKKGQKLEHGPIVATERFTQRPPRYTEASLVRKLEELGIGYVAFSPLANGILTGAYRAGETYAADDYRSRMPQYSPEAFEANRKLFEVLNQLARQKEATPAQISLAWMLCKKPYVVPIPGSRKAERIQENAGAAEIRLTGEEVAAIDQSLNSMEMSGVYGGAKILDK